MAFYMTEMPSLVGACFVQQQPQAQPSFPLLCFNWVGLTCFWTAVAPRSTWLLPGLAGDNEKQIGFFTERAGGATTMGDMSGAAGGVEQECVCFVAGVVLNFHRKTRSLRLDCFRYFHLACLSLESSLNLSLVLGE